MANSPNVIIVSETFARNAGDWCRIVDGVCGVHDVESFDPTECKDGETARIAAQKKGIPDDVVATKAEVDAARAALKVEYAKRPR